MNALRSAFALFAVAAAALSGAQVNIKPWNPQNQLNWSVLTSGTVSQFKQSSFQILNSQNDLQMYWMNATGQAPQTAPIGVNWMKEKLVAINIGQRPTGGYSVVVQNVVKNGVYGTVYAVEQKPPQGQWVSEHITSPYVIIKVDRSAAQLSLSMSQQEGGSNGGVSVYGPGLFRYNPANYDRQGGGGFVDPRFQADWSSFQSGRRSKVAAAGMVTLNNLSDWQRCWEKITGDPPQTAPGGVDWMKYRLVAINLGQRPTTGFDIKVINVERHGVYGVIRAVEEIPVAGARVRHRSTTPWVVIKVQREISQFNIDVTQREGNGDLRYNDGD
ncbi:protease complex subunit PrcB family protein [Fimbriimonas ginsengisoli]|uniref:PrcB C-terminal domain-containing protein n=1 Tax=Fimbriimonas ginsengisoli Gsoil 348 TaxID=661478 RepID=A0A068NQS3_FIMGI|nr:protease complex subunit PrcB family protein [Fimbriimonas ginsengisoli]AIE85732.1 hypothetical protein OP10G_2364 [Fimbriimonas ginsengisoli Gsoil 348]